MWKECFLCFVILFPDLKKYTKRTQGRNHFYLIWKLYCFCDSKLFLFLFHIFFSYLSFSVQYSYFFCVISCWFPFFLLIEVYGSFCVDSTCWCYTVSTENLVDLSHRQNYRNLSQGNYTITLVTTQFRKFRA